MGLVISLTKNEVNTGTCYVEDISTVSALIKVKDIIDNYNRELSMIYDEMNPYLASVYIFGLENIHGTKQPAVCYLTAESQDILERKFYSHYDIFFSKKGNEHQTHKEGVVAIGDNTINAHMGFINYDASLITINFDENRIYTKNLFNRMSVDTYCEIFFINTSEFSYDDFAEFDKDIESFRFNELSDIIDSIRYKYGYRIKHCSDVYTSVSHLMGPK